MKDNEDIFDKIYLDDNCAMCTKLGTIIRDLDCDIKVKRNSSSKLPVEITDNTVVCYDSKKQMYYFEFLAIFFAFSKSKSRMRSILFKILFFIMSILSFRIAYYFLSRNRLFFFKETSQCELNLFDD